MSFEITTTDVWFGEIEDDPGAIADRLEALMRAGANLEFAIVRPAADVASGTNIMFVAPLAGETQMRAAEEVGLRRAGTPHTLRIAGPDRPGLLAGITRTLAEAGIRVSGMWASTFSERGVTYVRLESGASARRAAQLLAPKLG